jgi:hypothetical protein
MNTITTLLNYLKKNPTLNKEEGPEGYCPNCWGRQEYGGKFYEVAKNYEADINSSNPSVGWVQEYANKHLSGIVLQTKNDELVCQNCKLTYSPKE